MCNSFTICSTESQAQAVATLAAALGASHPDAAAPGSAQPGTVAYPGMPAPVVVTASSNDGKLSLAVDELPFGVPVTWKSGSIFNARLESVLSGEGIWAEAADTGRCILPCASFFETHGSQKAKSPQTGRTVKQRYAFEAEDGAPLYLAAIRTEGGFAVVTTAPNQDVAPVHDRMPLTLTAHEAAIWLDPRIAPVQLAALADRSAVHLTSSPVLPSPPEDTQLTLPL